MVDIDTTIRSMAYVWLVTVETTSAKNMQADRSQQ